MIDEPEPRRDTSAEERPGATAAARAWNERYPRTRQVWSGEPNATLVAELEGLASGRGQVTPLGKNSARLPPLEG